EQAGYDPSAADVRPGAQVARVVPGLAEELQDLGGREVVDGDEVADPGHARGGPESEGSRPATALRGIDLGDPDEFTRPGRVDQSRPRASHARTAHTSSAGSARARTATHSASNGTPLPGTCGCAGSSSASRTIRSTTLRASSGARRTESSGARERAPVSSSARLTRSRVRPARG